jgi:hypothetical protein
MKKFYIGSIVALLAAFVLLPFTQGQTNAQSPGASSQSFNPRDFSGVWWVDGAGPDKLLDRGRTGDASKCETCHIPEHTMPEPPLTPWAKENLVAPNLPSNGTMGKFADSSMTPGGGAFHRNSCDPIGVPAQFWLTQLSPFEFVVTPDRIFQFFESHREYRTIWLNRDHPKKLDPSYMGDSVGKWEDDTLIVDTTGFNGKDMIEPVGVNHLMSDSFHLVERWRRASKNDLEVDVTYYDPKVWGDKSWGGLTKKFILQPNMELMEEYCTVGDNEKFDKMFLTPSTAPSK